jgi:hypothetical protein
MASKAGKACVRADKGQERGGRRMNRSELEMANWKVN